LTALVNSERILQYDDDDDGDDDSELMYRIEYYDTV